MTQSVNDRILALVKPEFFDRIPDSALEHAKTASCSYIEKEYPDLYQVASKAEPLPDEIEKELTLVINQLFEQRMLKHNF